MRSSEGPPDAALSLRVAVVDYDAGNIFSVNRALAAVGVDSYLASDAAALLAADAVVLPGVGAVGDAMRSLNERRLVEPLKRVVAAGRAFLGVCLGLQLLFDYSDEDGGVECLGLIRGGCHRFSGDLKVPHMGWNDVRIRSDHPIVQEIPIGAQFYFVHSYYAAPEDPSSIIGETEYGVTFPSIVGRDNIVAVQFHAEKSADCGLQIYRNFARFADSLRFNAPPPSALTADV